MHIYMLTLSPASHPPAYASQALEIAPASGPQLPTLENRMKTSEREEPALRLLSVATHPGQTGRRGPGSALLCRPYTPYKEEPWIYGLVRARGVLTLAVPNTQDSVGKRGGGCRGMPRALGGLESQDMAPASQGGLAKKTGGWQPTIHPPLL